MPKEFTRRAHDTFSAVPSHPSSRLNLPGMLRQAWIFNPTLTIFTILSALLTIVGRVWCDAAVDAADDQALAPTGAIRRPCLGPYLDPRDRAAGRAVAASPHRSPD